MTMTMMFVVIFGDLGQVDALSQLADRVRVGERNLIGFMFIRTYVRRILVLIVETVFRFCSEVQSRHLLLSLTSSAWLTFWREASGLCCWEESGSTRCRQPRTKRKTEEHFTVFDFSNKCFGKVFDLGAVVIEDDIETRHWLLAPLQFHPSWRHLVEGIVYQSQRGASVKSWTAAVNQTK